MEWKDDRGGAGAGVLGKGVLRAESGELEGLLLRAAKSAKRKRKSFLKPFLGFFVYTL